ncbi:MAG: DUF58 domain-containing protein [Ignavibacteriaceae bacterium]|jgi:uncharacterized protein (DUF58 family)|nr:DUF58 domain-containing protein [Ignavibacteriaceae bacterium]
MLSNEQIKQIRQIEIRTKALVNDIFSGEYHSVFKGRGMAFSEVREYQPGDDIRSIDWNVTARFGHPFVKIFEEERELTVMLIVDMSSSMGFGSLHKTKQQIAAELSGVLAFSALQNNDKVGLILFTDKIEKFVPPRKGKSHVLRIIREVLTYEPQAKQTNIKTALEFFNHAIKKKSIAFLVSDFMDLGYEKIIKTVSKKHDLISIAITDPRELSIPKGGLIRVYDAESNMVRHLDTSSQSVQAWFNETLKRRLEIRKSIFISSGVDSIEVNIKEDDNDSYIKPMINFFKMREKRW